MKIEDLKIGDEVIILKSAYYLGGHVGQVFTIVRNPRNMDVDVDYVSYRHYEYYFTTEDNETWVCLGERNCRIGDLRKLTKLDKVLK